MEQRSKIFLGLVLALVAVAPLLAGTGGAARLSGLNEVPALLTRGGGVLTLVMSDDRSEISYQLKYETTAAVLAAHIHVGQEGANGGVAATLCSNTAGAPAGTPACPERSGTVYGKISALNTQSLDSQGILAGEIEKLIEATMRGITYVNVHSERFPAGELRGQIDLTGPANTRDLSSGLIGH